MPKKKSNLQSKSELVAVRSLLGAIGALPLETSMRFGKALGKFLAKRLPKLQSVAQRNLKIAFPEMPAAEREKIVRGTFENLGRHLGLFAHLKRLNQAESIYEFEGLENLAEAQKQGRGVILFTGHFGAWELFNTALPLAGFPLHILVRKIDNPLVENLVEATRSHFGNQTIDKTSAARRLLKILNQGGIVGILSDLNTQEKEGVFVNFFGVLASTTSGLAKIAIHTGAPVLPIFAFWQEDRKKFLIKTEPPLDFEKTGNEAADVLNLTQKFTAVIEKYVRRYPEQWLWIHKRWNTRPEGEKNLY